MAAKKPAKKMASKGDLGAERAKQRASKAKPSMVKVSGQSTAADAMKAGMQARGRASKYGTPVGKTRVTAIGAGLGSARGDLGSVISKTTVAKTTAKGNFPKTKGVVTERKEVRVADRDTRKTTVKWNRGRGGSAKKK